MNGVADEGAFAHVVAAVVDLEAAHAAHEPPAHPGARPNHRQVPVAAQVQVLPERDSRVQALQASSRVNKSKHPRVMVRGASKFF